MTPDPYTNSGRLRDPQSWNRYAYTRGDPVNRYDPSGTDDEYPCTVGAGEGTEVVTCIDVTVPTSLDQGGYQAAVAAMEQAAQANQYVTQMSALNTYYRFKAAVQDAIKALSNDNCARLFNLDPDAPDPAILLSQIANNQNDSVYFTESYIGNNNDGTAVNAITTRTTFSMQNGTLVDTGAYANFVVAFNYNPAAPFNSASVDSNAVTILHELGHIYEDLYGLGSTLIVDDSTSTAASQYNTALVQQNCFPGSK